MRLLAAQEGAQLVQLSSSEAAFISIFAVYLLFHDI
jgi:hypothetical protein